MRARTSLLSLTLIATVSHSAWGQEILLPGPLAPTPPHYWVGAVPARLEWSYWAMGALAMTSTADSSDTGPLAGIGAEVTLEALRYHGFPSGWYGGKKGDAEMRVGPWVSAATRHDGGLVEGGLKVHFGGIFHASFGTWDVRFGTGFGAYEQGRAPHATATLAYGVRSVLARYPKNRNETVSDRPPDPPLFAEASVARLFVTYRHAFDLDESREVVVGVELSPTFFLPPYSLWRFGGGPPW